MATMVRTALGRVVLEVIVDGSAVKTKLDPEGAIQLARNLVQAAGEADHHDHVLFLDAHHEEESGPLSTIQKALQGQVLHESPKAVSEVRDMIAVENNICAMWERA